MKTKSSEVSKYFQLKISPDTKFSDKSVSTEIIATSAANKALHYAITVHLCVLPLLKPVSFSIPTHFGFQYGLHIHGWRLGPPSALLHEPLSYLTQQRSGKWNVDLAAYA